MGILLPVTKSRENVHLEDVSYWTLGKPFFECFTVIVYLPLYLIIFVYTTLLVWIRFSQGLVTCNQIKFNVSITLNIYWIRWVLIYILRSWSTKIKIQKFCCRDQTLVIRKIHVLSIMLYYIPKTDKTSAFFISIWLTDVHHTLMRSVAHKYIGWLSLSALLLFCWSYNYGDQYLRILTWNYWWEKSL